MRYIFLFLILLSPHTDNDFLDKQMEFPRVRNAVSEKLDSVKNIFAGQDISVPPAEIGLQIWKTVIFQIFLEKLVVEKIKKTT